MKKINVGALISGGGTNLQAIIDACQKNEIDAKLSFVGSDNPHAKGLLRAEKAGIPSFVVDYPKILKEYSESPENDHLPNDFDLDEISGLQKIFPEKTEPEKIKHYLESRAICEAKLIRKMAEYEYDLLVLAGFMRILTPYFINRVNKGKWKIMNIHPAILPSFPGVDGYGDTFEYGCRIGGSTVHFVDYGEDSGPIIDQECFRILPNDTLDSVKEKGLKLEWLLYPRCIHMFAQNRLEVVLNENNRKTVIIKN